MDAAQLTYWYRIIETLNKDGFLTPPPDKGMLWSMLGEDGDAEANRIAVARGLVTLNMLLKKAVEAGALDEEDYKALDPKTGDRQLSEAIFKQLSKTYARNLTGRVTAFVNGAAWKNEGGKNQSMRGAPGDQYISLMAVELDIISDLMTVNANVVVVTLFDSTTPQDFVGSMDRGSVADAVRRQKGN